MKEEFEGIYTELNKLEASSEEVSIVIQRVILLERKVRVKIRELERLLDKIEKEGGAAGGGPINKISDEILKKCHEILWSEIQVAIKVNREFDDEFFRTRLFAAAFHPDTIKIDILSGGNFFVGINLNEVAGSLRDYARGIERTRADLGIADFHELTNHFWQEKLYGPAREGKLVKARKQKEGSKRKAKSSAQRTKEAIGKYWKTMQMRMENSGKIAPFWEILDKGTVDLLSNKGGDAYPTNFPTNFTTKTILKIEELLSSSGGKGKKDVENININIDNIRTLIASYLEILERITKLLKELNEESIIKKALERIKSYEERADPERLEEVIRAVQAGDLSNLNITSEGRVEVTAPAGIRTRISLVLVSRTLGEIEAGY